MPKQKENSDQESSESEALSLKNSDQNTSEDDVDLDRPMIKPPDPEGVARKKNKGARRDKERKRRKFSPGDGGSRPYRADSRRERNRNSESPAEKRRRSSHQWRSAKLYEMKRKTFREFESGKDKGERRAMDYREGKGKRGRKHHRQDGRISSQLGDNKRQNYQKRDSANNQTDRQSEQGSASKTSSALEDERREELMKIEKRIAELKGKEVEDMETESAARSGSGSKELGDSSQSKASSSTSKVSAATKATLIDAEVEDVSASESDSSSASVHDPPPPIEGSRNEDLITTKYKESTVEESSSESESDDYEESDRPRLLPAAYTSKFDNLDDSLDSPEKGPVKKKSSKANSKSSSRTNSPNRSKIAQAGEQKNEPPLQVVKEAPQIQIKPEEPKKPLLPIYFPALQGCRSVDEFKHMNKIDEGTYGVVYRAQDLRTNEIVALKRLKMEKEREGFPITSLREINCLLKSQHPNVVPVREIVVGSNMDKIYLVMDYVEHDLKALMEIMKQPFLIREVKTIMLQLLEGVRHLHDNWILHRDLKASNLLFSHKGQLKIGDFGLAREYGSPLKPYTPIVVTLWYRAPELLLGTKLYSKPIDMWSVGCIFGELLTQKPMFAGKSETEQLNQIFKELGTPNEKIWPDWPNLPMVKKIVFTEYPYNNLRNKFGTSLTEKGISLLNGFLTFDPKRRLTAADSLKHDFFKESPKPIDPSQFPTWPAKSEGGISKEKKMASPKAPEGGDAYNRLLANEDDTSLGFQLTNANMGLSKKGSGFTLKF